MTEQEAKTKWCPFARNLGTLTKASPDGAREIVTAFGPQNRGYQMGGALHNCMCIGSACMALRSKKWMEEIHSEPSATSIGIRYEDRHEVYCGLAGKP
jgi:hypothetical protein